MIGPGAGLAIATMNAINPPPQENTRAGGGANGGCRFNEHYMHSTSKFKLMGAAMSRPIYMPIYTTRSRTSRESRHIARSSDALGPRPARGGRRRAPGRGAIGRRLYVDTTSAGVRNFPDTILDVHKPMTIRYNPTPRESCDVCSASPHSRNHASSALSAHIAPRSTLFGSLFPLRLAFARAMRPCPCHRHRAAAAPSSRP
jgi:hypothetical protein